MSQEKAKPRSEANITKILICLAIGTVIALIPPLGSLTAQSMQYLGIFVGMIVALLISAAPMWAVTTFSALMCVILKLSSFNTLFAEFSGSTIWMVLSVVGFAACLQASGIMKRIAFNILKFFPPNHAGQVLALMTAGVVIGPLIPSSNAKLAIMAPFTGTIAKESGMKPHGNGVKGLWFILWMVNFIASPIFLTGSNICIILLGMIPQETAAHFTWMNWFFAAAPWGIPLLVLTALYVIMFMRPEEKMDMSKDTIKKQISDLGPMSSDEKFCGIVLAVTIVLWITTDLHGISNTIVSWLALLAMHLRGLFGSRDLVAKLPWSMIMMFGPMMGVTGLMGSMGIVGFVGEILPADLVRSLIPNGFVFVIIMVFMTIILRMVITSSMSILPIMIAVFTPVAEMLGINLWVIVFITWVNVQIWPLPHMGSMIMQSQAMMGAGEDIVNLNDVRWMSWIYTLISAISCLICVPFWMGMGLM